MIANDKNLYFVQEITMITLSKESINANNKFSQERINYARLLQAMNDDDILLFGSKKDDYIIAQWNSATIMWIWTSNDITEEEKQEILNFINEKYLTTELRRVIIKKDIFSLLNPEIIKNKTIWNASINPTPVLNKEIKGELSKVTMEEIQIIALFLSQHIEETENEVHTLEEMLPIAKKLIENENFYAWRDVDGQIASFARLHFEDDEVGRIYTVFTNRDKRCQGFAGMLIYHLSKIIIDNGKIPMLYTDIESLAANKAYQNVGFMVQDQLIEVNLNRDKIAN